MTGFDRNLKYWFYYVGKSMFYIYAMIIGIVAVMSLLDGSNFVDTFTENIVLYLTMASAMSVIVFGFTNITVMFPVTVSMSSRRRTSLVAMNVAQQVIGLLSFTISFICALIKWPMLKEMLSLVIPAFLGLIGVLFFLGNVVAFLSERFGRTVGMVLYIIFIFVIVFVCTLGICVVKTGRTFSVIMANPQAFAILFCAAGIILDVLGVVLVSAGLNKKEIKYC